jgi:hypothetical protein
MKNQKSQLEKQLLELAASELPLSLVPDLLEAVDRQAIQERGATDAELIGTLLTERDQQLLAFLKSKGASAKVLALQRALAGG